MDPPFPPLLRASSAASGRTKKTTDPKLLDMHMDKQRLRLMYNVTECNVHPSCIFNMSLGHRATSEISRTRRS